MHQSEPVLLDDDGEVGPDIGASEVPSPPPVAGPGGDYGFRP